MSGGSGTPQGDADMSAAGTSENVTERGQRPLFCVHPRPPQQEEPGRSFLEPLHVRGRQFPRTLGSVFYALFPHRKQRMQQRNPNHLPCPNNFNVRRKINQVTRDTCQHAEHMQGSPLTATRVCGQLHTKCVSCRVAWALRTPSGSSVSPGALLLAATLCHPCRHPGSSGPHVTPASEIRWQK